MGSRVDGRNHAKKWGDLSKEHNAELCSFLREAVDKTPLMKRYNERLGIKARSPKGWLPSRRAGALRVG